MELEWVLASATVWALAWAQALGAEKAKELVLASEAAWATAWALA